MDTMASKAGIAARALRRVSRMRHREARLSFAQEAEDLVLLRSLQLYNDRPGYYVDIGAHEPKWISNTFLLYTMGWEGVCVDASSKHAAKFAKVRPRDTFVEAVVGTPGHCQFVEFSRGALSGISSSTADERIAEGMQVVSRREVAREPLHAILDDHVPADQEIDLLSVDVEGAEADVLLSNDWGKYRPRVLLVECGDSISFTDVGRSEPTRVLQREGYEAFAKTGLTVFYADSELLKSTTVGFYVAERS